MANLIRRGEAPVERRWDPFEMMREMMAWDPFRELGGPLGRAEAFVPSFDVKETKDGYVFKADLPGVKEKDLEISLTGNRLTVSGHREEERKQEEEERYYAYERSSGTFTRSFTLPEGIDPDSASAELKEGVLTLHLSKRPEVKAKRIELGPTPRGRAAGREPERGPSN
jgi:HSP20 family protein